MTLTLFSAHVWQHTSAVASILFGGGFTVAACVSIGSRTLGAAGKDWAIRFVAGAAVLSLIVFAVCSARLAYPAVFLAIGIIAIAWGWPVRPRFQFNFPSGIGLVLLLCAILYMYRYLIYAMAPEVSPDGAAYHLGFVALFLRNHGFERVNWNMYASLPEGVEMLYLYTIAFGRHSAAAVVHFSFLVALVWQMVEWGRRTGYVVVSWPAAILVLASPLVGIDGTSAYNDVALAAVAFTLFNLLQRWDLDRSPRLLVALGLVAGFAFSIKYTAWPALLYAAGYVALKSRSWKNIALVCSCSAAVVLPWLIKNLLWVENPLAPFFNHWFPNPYVTAAFEASYRHDMSIYDLTSQWQIPMQVTVGGGLGGVLGPVFLLSPLALLALRLPQGRSLLLAALVFGMNYFSNISPRFLIPMLPFVALAMGVGLNFAPRVFVALALIHAVISWPTLVPKYAGAHSWTLPKLPLRAALRIESEDTYLQKHLYDWNEVQMIEHSTPPNSSVFTYRQLPEAYTSRRILTEYESEPNELAGVMLRAAYDTKLQPTWQLHLEFSPRELTGLRLVQTTVGQQQWNIHELRVFNGAEELAPRGWLATASPYPFRIENAFDGNPITLWRAGELLAPGDYVEVGFPQPVLVSSVVMQSEPNLADLHIKLKGQITQSTWVELADRGTAAQSPPPEDLRCIAARELKRRGIDFILAWNDEPETADLRRAPSSWCATEVAQTKDARLYRLP